jgi:hypothetical protein
LVENKAVKPPICGAPQHSLYSFTDAQMKPPSLPMEEYRSVVRMAYKCPCDSNNLCESVGRTIIKPKKKLPTDPYKLVNQIFSSIEKISNVKQDELIECPWVSFFNPLWIEVQNIDKLKSITGENPNPEKTDAIVYEAWIFYRQAFNAINNHVLIEEHKEIEDQMRKQKQTFNP